MATQGCGDNAAARVNRAGVLCFAKLCSAESRSGHAVNKAGRGHSPKIPQASVLACEDPCIVLGRRGSYALSLDPHQSALTAMGYVTI